MSLKHRAVRVVGWVLAVVGLILLIQGLLPIPDPTKVANPTDSEGYAIALALRPYVLGAGAVASLLGIGVLAFVRHANRQQA